MRILMVVSNEVVHDPRVLKEAHALQEAGHHVTCIGWDRSGKGEPYEERGGLAILRVRTDAIMRALGRDLFRLPLWWRRARKLAEAQDFDVVHCHDLDTLPVGVDLKRARGTLLVYDCHEVFGFMIENDVPRLVVDRSFRTERRLAPQADLLITVNDAVKQYIDGISGRNAVVVRNCSDVVLETYRPPPKPFTIIYLGGLMRSRFILPAIEVVAQMPDVRLLIGGRHHLTAAVKAACARHPNTRFLGMVPSDRVFPMTVDAHVVLSMFDPAYRINQVGLPNKIFEAMAAGRPCLVTKGLWMAELVEREDCGLAVPYTEAGFRDAVERLRADPALVDRLGRNGLAAAKREYNWDHEKRTLLSGYQDLSGIGRDARNC